jgi:hypothetical protein
MGGTRILVVRLSTSPKGECLSDRARLVRLRLYLPHSGIRAVRELTTFISLSKYNLPDTLFVVSRD